MLAMVNCDEAPQQEVLLSLKQTLLTWDRSVDKGAFASIKLKCPVLKPPLLLQFAPQKRVDRLVSHMNGVQEAGHVHFIPTHPGLHAVPGFELCSVFDLIH